MFNFKCLQFNLIYFLLYGFPHKRQYRDGNPLIYLNFCIRVPQVVLQNQLLILLSNPTISHNSQAIDIKINSKYSPLLHVKYCIFLEATCKIQCKQYINIIEIHQFYFYIWAIISFNIDIRAKDRIMNNDDIFAWIVSKPQNYPGRHLMSQARTFEAVKPLDPKAQFHLIFKALGEYIKENMLSGKGINYRGFGAFAFQVATDLVKPAQLSNFDIKKQLNNQRQQRMHNHKIRPCFVPDKQLSEQLIRHPGKQQIEKPKSQHNIYQKGFSMIYCNPVPIANSCYLDKQTTNDALTAFAKAVADLTSLGKTLQISLNPIKIRIQNRDISYTYSKQFSSSLNLTQYQKQMKKSLKQTKSHWTDSYDQKWNESTLGSLINKPKVEEIAQVYEKGLGLKIMSLDFNTTESVVKNRNRQ